ncbi:hypothetical protein COV19_06305 [Candidatus Woesearchaeota archaeon CG10_big_fil_rev_8_21_14_0_10_44_13]|nr:MAG: hypothetical protein COV19_06305 [Candidatus Woesearchaeota archaeon CG10_big_fil_rev_8_21_14_0_10_44_13]
MAFFMPIAASAETISYTDTYYVDFFVTLKDINSGEIIPSMPVDMVWVKDGTGGTINLTKYIDKRGTFSYRISPGKWSLLVYIDNLSTPEVDYTGESAYTITEDLVTRGEVLYVVPVGSIEVEVSDQSANLVAGADVDFKCKSHRTSAKTDKFGSYKADFMPVGECKIYAASNNLVGSTSAIVAMGRSKTVEVILSEEVKTSYFKSYFYYIMFGAFLVVLLALSYFLIRKRIKKEVREEFVRKVKKRFVSKEKAEKKESRAEKSKEGAKAAKEEKEAKDELNPRARDVMKTLNDKEQKIVNVLLQNGNKSTQATIRNETGIPKTTLARVFQSLESKNVVKVETIGKLKKVELTEWFLGKD